MPVFTSKFIFGTNFVKKMTAMTLNTNLKKRYSK